MSGPAATLPQMGTASKHGRHAPRNERVITLNLRAPDNVAIELFVINEDSAHALGLP